MEQLLNICRVLVNLVICTRVIQKFKIQNCEVLDHPAHSPDFDSNIFHLSSHLKKLLVARNFTKTER